MVKKMMPEAPAKPPRLRESASSPPREQRAQIEKEKSRCDSLQGKFIEMGLLGITQSFGANVHTSCLRTFCSLCMCHTSCFLCMRSRT